MSGARSVQKAAALAAGRDVNTGVKLSGADLEQAKLLTQASTTVGPGKDGARLAQIAAGD